MRTVNISSRCFFCGLSTTASCACCARSAALASAARFCCCAASHRDCACMRLAAMASDCKRDFSNCWAKALSLAVCLSAWALCAGVRGSRASSAMPSGHGVSRYSLPQRYKVWAGSCVQSVAAQAQKLKNSACVLPDAFFTKRARCSAAPGLRLRIRAAR